MTPNAEIVSQYERMFDAIRRICTATATDPQTREIRRICLHAAEAVENYMTDRPPQNYGGNLKHGIRSRPGAPEVSTEDVIRYAADTCQATRRYLELVDLSKANDVWGKSPLSRVLYVMRHTQHHLGQASQLVPHNDEVKRGYGLCAP